KDGDFFLTKNEIRKTTQGISLWSNKGRTLRGVRVQDNRITMARHEHYKDVWLGIYLYYFKEDPETTGDFEDITLTDNTISFERVTAGTITAVGIDRAPGARASKILVKGNTILASPATGIRIGNAETRNTSRDIRVENNTIIDAGKDRTTTK